jgi:hypothetical protein
MFASQAHRHSDTRKSSGNHGEGFTERRSNNTGFKITQAWSTRNHSREDTLQSTAEVIGGRGLQNRRAENGRDVVRRTCKSKEGEG